MRKAVDHHLPGRARPCPRPEEIIRLIENTCGSSQHLNDFGSFSTSLYDTAWLSMVPSGRDQNTRLFPQCLDVLLLAQLPDGTWPSYASPTDGILVSLAALLSLATNRAQTCSPSDERDRFAEPIERGVTGVEKLLQSWEVEHAVHVGFEILVTSLIRQLESLAINFNFPKLDKLMEFYKQKIRNFSPELLYGQKETTLLHSVEAFVGLIDFERISHRCSEELGVLGSPAATAAYLIHSTEWDSSAEMYLQRVFIANGSTGKVPSAFPTSLFEVPWALSFMVSPIFEACPLKTVHLNTIHKAFSDAMSEQGNLVGFAPKILADADCTARNLLMLMRLRRFQCESDIDVAPLVGRFEAAHCFKTYELERNPSFSANCNVAIALLEAEPKSEGYYNLQIEKALAFLLNQFENGPRDINDKWNLSPGYSYMLFLEVLISALEKFDAGNLKSIAKEISTHRIPKAVHRVLSQILTSQKTNGSWDDSVEITSYHVLGMFYALRLPWATSIREFLANRIQHAQLFIAAEYPKARREECLWIEKTTYQSSLLRITYCSLALHMSLVTVEWKGTTIEQFNRIDPNNSAMKKLFLILPLLREVPEPVMDLILMEAKYDTRILATGKYSILPETDVSAKKTKFLEYIPAIWLLCNYINNNSLSTAMIGEMLRLSQATFQVDAYMETTIAGLSQDQTRVLESWIKHACNNTDITGIKDEGCDGSQADPFSNNGIGNEDEHQNTKIELTALESVQTTLQRFLRYILLHEAVLRNSQLIRRFLVTDVCEYLLAHMQQNRDNELLEKSKRGLLPASQPLRGSYFSWARGTGADHTSCPFAFRFFMCLIGCSNAIRSTLETPQVQYLSSSVSRHLATLCRQYNDLGSISRDQAEHNLNSVDFAEFHVNGLVSEPLELKECEQTRPTNGASLPRVAKSPGAKDNLMAIAEFERKLMELSFEVLRNSIRSSKVIQSLKVLVDVTDLFGQLYVAKDIGIRKRKAEDMTG